MIILQVIVIHFSFDIMRTFASFSGHTLSVEVHSNHRLKLSKNIGDGFYEQRKFTIVFIAREIISK